MAEQTKNGGSDKRLNEDQRFKYIGFEVFPGKPKDLFKNENEKKQLEAKVAEKRSKGEVLRDDCLLMIDRVSMGERILLSVASLLIIAALFLPFYSAYMETEVVEEVAATVPLETAADTTAISDSAGLLVAAEAVAGDSVSAEAGLVEEAAVDAVPGAAGPATGNLPGQNVQIDDRGNEVITGMMKQKKYIKDYTRVSGLGSLIGIGSLGSYIFSSGFILMLTGVIYLLYTLACIAIPVWTLYILFGTKAKGDDLALQIKKVLKLAWWPVAAFVFSIFLSFGGAEYGFATTDMFTSIGSSFSVGVLLDTLSVGVPISLAGFIILAAKGSEI